MIPQFAPVAPLSILQHLDEHDLLGHYQLVIAPIVLEDAAEYRRFFQIHDDQLVILDNGVIELGYPLPARDLFRAAQIVGAHVVVMPDSIDDAKMTVKLARRHIEDYRALDPKTDILGVVQGVTLEECLWCANELVRLGVDWLSVPRGLTPNLKSRVPLIREVAKLGKPIHVLGFSENVEDDILTVTQQHPLIKGIDAATPVWSPTPLPKHPPTVMGLGRRPENYWYRGPESFPLAAVNVHIARQWIAQSVVRVALTDAGEQLELMDL